MSDAGEHRAMVGGVAVVVHRVRRLALEVPPVRAPATRLAAQKHGARLAADAVIVSDEITTDPGPHGRTPVADCFAPRQARCQSDLGWRRVQFRAEARSGAGTRSAWRVESTRGAEGSGSLVTILSRLSALNSWTVTKNDFDALGAAYAGLNTTCSRVQGMGATVASLESLVGSETPEAPADLIRAATAHAIAAAAFSGLLHRLFTKEGVAPTTMELTDSAGESAS